MQGTVESIFVHSVHSVHNIGEILSVVCTHLCIAAYKPVDEL